MTIVCRPKTLSTFQHDTAIRRSIEVNPDNASTTKTVERTVIGSRGGPRRLALVTGLRWPKEGMKLTVQFLDTKSKGLKSKILKHLNAWSEFTSMEFVETDGTGMVRIARAKTPVDMAGYWSYVGTEILGIEDDQPTMNLEGFTTRTSDAEFRRVVRHEAGHTLGFEHEHMRKELVKKIDRQKAITYFDITEGWTKEETIEQVLTPLSKRSILGTTESDPISIMCYEIPGEITKDGKPIIGGNDISAKDAEFARTVYPKQQGGSRKPESSREPIPKMKNRYDIDPDDDSTFNITIMSEFLPEENKNGKAKKQKPMFAQVFASFAGARVTSSMRLRANRKGATAFGRIISTHESIKNYTNELKGALPLDSELTEFGTDLFETLFQGDVRRLYDEARSRIRGRKLDIILTSMIPWIAEKPWEFAFDPVRRSFLATEEIHLVRNVLTAIPANMIPPTMGPLKILVVSAQPVSFDQLSVAEETQVIERGFKPLIDAGLVKIEVLARTTPSQLHKLLSTGKFSIVHFIGHGIFDEQTQEGALVFENGLGGEIILKERSVREIFCQRGVGLVFLNSCQSGSGGRADFNKGVAQSLVAHGIPALVANQYSVLDSSATAFSKHFYWALAQGMTVGSAACEARIAVNYGIAGEPIDWAVPVVYARDPDMTLAITPTKPAKMLTSVETLGRKSIARKRTVRIAVWDIDNLFPFLEQTLERMNDAQSEFSFELAVLSAPMGVWDTEELAEDKKPYLDAPKLAEKLAHAPVELNVNILACISGRWMRDEEWLNLYGWWPESMKPPVIVFSSAGFDLSPSGMETDRAIMNVMISGLAGFLGDLGTHERGSRNCPLFFDEGRDRESLISVQKFDLACRRKLKRKIPNQLAAFESIQKAFI